MMIALKIIALILTFAALVLMVSVVIGAILHKGPSETNSQTRYKGAEMIQNEMKQKK